MFAIVTAVLIGVAVYKSAPERPPAPAGPTPAATFNASPSPTPSPSTKPGTSLGAARKVLKGPATISIIGDSTGNDENEWVALWAADLGVDRQVTLQRWREGRYLANPLEFGRRGDRVTIWNASLPGGDAGWAVDQIHNIQPDRPDLVILSFGHNNDSGDIGPQLQKLQSRLEEGVPVVLILQNPGRGAHQEVQAATLRSAEQWAVTHQVPTVDVTDSFTNPDEQMRDNFHPNDAGSRLWAKTVARALTP